MRNPYMTVDENGDPIDPATLVALKLGIYEMKI